MRRFVSLRAYNLQRNAQRGSRTFINLPESSKDGFKSALTPSGSPNDTPLGWGLLEVPQWAAVANEKWKSKYAPEKHQLESKTKTLGPLGIEFSPFTRDLELQFWRKQWINLGQQISDPEKFLIEHYHRTPFSSFQSMNPEEQSDVKKEMNHEMNRGTEAAYRHLADIFNSKDTEPSNYDESLGLPLANLLTHQNKMICRDFTSIALDDEGTFVDFSKNQVRIEEVQCEVVGMRVLPYSMEPRFFKDAMLGERFWVNIYTLWVLNQMEKEVPLRFQVLSKVQSREAFGESGFHLDSINADWTEHYIQIEWLYQAFKCDRVNQDSPLCRPLISNLNFVIDDIPKGLGKDEQPELPQELVEMMKQS